MLTLFAIPTSAWTSYVVTLLICDEVVWFGCFGFVIHLTNLLSVFEVTTLARWISFTAHIASKKFPGFRSFIGVTAECLATNWDLIKFTLLASRPTCAHQRYQVKYTKCHRHLACDKPNFSKDWKKIAIKIDLGNFLGLFFLASSPTDK